MVLSLLTGQQWVNMNKAKFLKEVDKILRTNTGSISMLIEERSNFNPDKGNTLINELAKHLKEGDYHLSPEHIDELWEIVSNYDSTNLIDALLKIQGGKYNSNNLDCLLKTGFPKGLDYIFNLIKEHPESYQYELDDRLYEVLEGITEMFYDLKQGKEILRYFLEAAKSLPTFQSIPNKLLYATLIYENWAAEAILFIEITPTTILLEFGADPFANYWEEDIDTGIPIIFKAMRNDPSNIQLLLESTIELKGWNITDEWGRNLLHYAINDEIIYEMLLEKGVDPDHRALIDDEAKVVTAKMNGTLPPEYGKTPREMLKAIVND